MHFAHCGYQLFGVLFLEAEDELGHFLVVVGLDTSLELLFNRYFGLLFVDGSFIISEKIGLLHVDQIDQVERESDKNFVFESKYLMIDDLAVFWWWELKDVSLVFEGDFVVFELKGNLQSFKASLIIVNDRFCVQVTDVGWWVVVNILFLEHDWG